MNLPKESMAVLRDAVKADRTICEHDARELLKFIAYLRRRSRWAEEAKLPRVSAIFETCSDGITGTTSADVKRVEREDDGSLTVVLDYWPQ